jgi:hypothetical protein
MAYNGDRYLFEGLRSLGQQLSDSITAADEGHKRENQQAKAADAFWKSLPESDKKMSDWEYQNMSARDRAGHITGIISGQQYAKGAQDMLHSIAATRAMDQATQQGADLFDAKKRMELAQALAMEQSNAKNAQTAASVAALNADLKQRLDPSFVGPQPPMDEQATLQLLGKNGLLMDPQADNLLNAVTKGQPKRTFGVPGTVAELPGTDNVFAWLSPESGTVLRKPGAQQQPTAAPPGYALVRDQNGKATYLKLETSKTPPNPLVNTYQNVISNLQALKAQGHDRADVSKEFIVTPSKSNVPLFRGSKIDELLQQYQNMLGALAPTAGAAQPSSGSLFDEYIKSKQGK